MAFTSLCSFEANSSSLLSSSLPMKVELAVNQMPCDDASLQQKKELLLKERSELLVSLHAQQQACAQMEFFRYGFSVPFPPAFRPPPGLSLPSQTAHHVANSSQKQFTKVCSDEDSDQASTCSGCAESFEAASVSDSIGSTVIMRNIPNRFSQATLAAVLDEHGFFAEEAERLMASFHGFKWGGASKKVCGVTLCDDNESPTERVERYRNMPVMHSSVPESFKPAMYSGGQRVPFPAPTKRLRAPRMKKQ